MRRLLLLSLLLAAGRAAAQDESASLDGMGRISLQAGWRVTSNETFFESFYALPVNQGLPPDGRSTGGPFLAGSFGYAATDLIEVGIDLFATGEQLRPTGAPALTTLTYGALVGVRFQTLLSLLTPEGVVPFIGVMTGPTLTFSRAEQVGSTEQVTQAWVATAGASFRFTPRWALTAEYRLAFVRGVSAFNQQEAYQNLASYNAGGSWFALGVTYFLPPTPSRPFSPP
jgi:opacity protein-like surface antigen